MAIREEEIRGLKELQAKQNQIHTLNKKIKKTQSEIAALRKKRTKTDTLELLPTDTAQDLEDNLQDRCTRKKQRNRTILKISCIILLIALLFASDWIIMNRTLAAQEVPAPDGSVYAKYDLGDFIVIVAITTVGLLVFTFVSQITLLSRLLLSIIGGFLTLISIACCCISLREVNPICTFLPALAIIPCVTYQFLDWRVWPAPLTEDQLAQIELARLQDALNHEQNQRDRTAYSRELERQQRQQIISLNDRINELEDQVNLLEEELADNDLLVGDQLEQLDTVLKQLQSGKVQSIRQALYGNVTDAYIFDEAESKRLDREMRSVTNQYLRDTSARQEAQLAAEARKQVDAHARKIEKLRDEQDQLLDQIEEELEDRNLPTKDVAEIRKLQEKRRSL